MAKHRASISPAPYYCGGNVGLGFPDADSYFSVEVGSKRFDWTISETLARLHQFTKAAQQRILNDCALQNKYPGRLDLQEG